MRALGRIGQHQLVGNLFMNHEPFQNSATSESYYIRGAVCRTPEQVGLEPTLQGQPSETRLAH